MARTHRLHGDPARFDVVAEFVQQRHGSDVRYIADVAGGQGLLTRVLRKRHGYDCEVVDPRGWALRGVPVRAAEFSAGDAGYYDLIVGLHPDEATRAVAEAARIRPALLIPCCNFWSTEKLGRDALLEAIGHYYREHCVRFERIEFGFHGPMNVGLVSEPPRTR